MLTYVVNRGSISNSARLNKLLKKALSPRTGTTVMTYAEQLIDEGVARGRTEGKTEGKLTIARKLLEKEDADVNDVARLVELPISQIVALKTELTAEI